MKPRPSIPNGGPDPIPLGPIRFKKCKGDEYRWPEFPMTDGGIDGIGVIRGLGGGVR